jgi:hypothetical protein
MSRLFKARRKLVRSKGGLHSAGLIAATNLASLVSALRAGSWLVGAEHDAYCLNCVCYEGKLCDAFPAAETTALPVEDVSGISRLFENGWIGRRMDRVGEGRNWFMRFARYPRIASNRR